MPEQHGIAAQVLTAATSTRAPVTAEVVARSVGGARNPLLRVSVMKQFMLPLVADPKDLVASITMTRAGEWSRTDKHKVFITFIRVQVLRSLFDTMTSAHGHEPAVRATLTALHGNQPSDKLLLDKFAHVVSEAVKSLTALRTAAMECDTVVQQTPLLKAEHSALQIAIDIAAECPTQRQANRKKISSLRSSARMGPTRHMPDYVGALNRAPPLLGQAAIAACSQDYGIQSRLPQRVQKRHSSSESERSMDKHRYHGSGEAESASDDRRAQARLRGRRHWRHWCPGRVMRLIPRKNRLSRASSAKCCLLRRLGPSRPQGATCARRALRALTVVWYGVVDLS